MASGIFMKMEFVSKSPHTGYSAAGKRTQAKNIIALTVISASGVRIRVAASAFIKEKTVRAQGRPLTVGNHSHPSSLFDPISGPLFKSHPFPFYEGLLKRWIFSSITR
jgi:hypothetical protein